MLCVRRSGEGLIFETGCKKKKKKKNVAVLQSGGELVLSGHAGKFCQCVNDQSI